MKKIVCLLGSPRAGGNTEVIARKLMDKAESLGAQTQVFALNKLTYRGCQGCYACKKTAEVCVLRDDLTEVLKAVSEADVLLFASPIYFGDVTAQIKGFVDRSYSFLKPTYLTDPEPSRLAPGKKCVFIFTQAHPDAGEFDIYDKYDRFTQWMGYETHQIRGVGVGGLGMVDAPERSDLMQQAEDMAVKVME